MSIEFEFVIANSQNTDTRAYVLCDVQAWWRPVRTAETCSGIKYRKRAMLGGITGLCVLHVSARADFGSSKTRNALHGGYLKLWSLGMCSLYGWDGVFFDVQIEVEETAEYRPSFICEADLVILWIMNSALKEQWSIEHDPL
jgi:hypothetical protein